VCCLAAAAVIVVVAATAATQIVAIAVATAAEQQNQNDDPPATVATPRITAHNRYLRKKICYGLRRTFHVIPVPRKGAGLFSVTVGHPSEGPLFVSRGVF
jgi:hypothetical protein